MPDGYVRRNGILRPDYSQDITEGLVAWWPLNERGGLNARDIIGNNHGTLTNGPVWAVEGIKFDGTNDYVDAGTLGTFGQSIKTSTFSCMFRNPGTATVSLAGTFNTGTVTGWQILVNEGVSGSNLVGRFRFLIRDEAGNELDFQNTTAVSPDDGNWHTVTAIAGITATTGALIYDGQNLPLNYGNVGTVSTTANFAFPFLLGARSNRATPDLFFPGSISRARLWNRALGIHEAQELHQNPDAGLWIPDTKRYYVPAAGGGFQPAWAANSNIVLSGAMAL